MSDAEPCHPVVTAAVCVTGERTVSAEALATLQGTTLAAVERSVGGRTICASARSGVELGLDAAKRCLERAGCAAEDVGAIIWFGEPHRRPGMYLQDGLGAVRANPIALAFNCTELVTALEYARTMMRADAELDRVLLVGGAVWHERLPMRSAVRLTERAFETVFSDAGAALLVQRDGAGAEIVSTGSGSVGSLWDYNDRVLAPKPDDPRGPVPTILQALLYSKPAHDRALADCLRRGGVTTAELDHILFAREPGGIERTLMRTLSLDAQKLWDPPGGPTHNGISDQFLGLEQLMQGVAQPDARILVVARTIGLMRCALLRMRRG